MERKLNKMRRRCSEMHSFSRKQRKKILRSVILYSTIITYIMISSLKLPFKNSKFLKLFGISLALTSYIIKYRNSEGSDLADHSKINLIFASACIIVLTILYILIWFHFVYLPKKFIKGYLRVIKYIYYSYIIFILLRFYFITVLRSCENIDDGVLRKEGYCNWEKQTICWHYIADGFFKPAFWFGRGNCKYYKDDFSNEKKLAGSTGVVSFPLLKELSRMEKNNQYDLPNGYLRLRKQASGDEILNGDREVFIDFRRKEWGEVVVKLKNLVERDEKVKNTVLPHDEEHPNFLMIFIDTLSKQQFHRKYQKLKKFFKRRYHKGGRYQHRGDGKENTEVKVDMEDINGKRKEI